MAQTMGYLVGPLPNHCRPHNTERDLISEGYPPTAGCYLLVMRITWDSWGVPLWLWLRYPTMIRTWDCGGTTAAQFAWPFGDLQRQAARGSSSASTSLAPISGQAPCRQLWEMLWLWWLWVITVSRLGRRITKKSHVPIAMVGSQP